MKITLLLAEPNNKENVIISRHIFLNYEMFLDNKINVITLHTIYIILEDVHKTKII